MTPKQRIMAIRFSEKFSETSDLTENFGIEIGFRNVSVMSERSEFIEESDDGNNNNCCFR